ADSAIRSNERQPVSGAWTRDCSQWGWTARAREWDRAMLAQHGLDAVLAFVEALRRVTRQALEAAERLDGPSDWGELMETMLTIAQMIPPETVQALIAAGQCRGTRDQRGPDPGA